MQESTSQIRDGGGIKLGPTVKGRRRTGILSRDFHHYLPALLSILPHLPTSLPVLRSYRVPVCSPSILHPPTYNSQVAPSQGSWQDAWGPPWMGSGPLQPHLLPLFSHSAPSYNGSLSISTLQLGFSHTPGTPSCSPSCLKSPSRPSTPCALHPEVTHPLVSLENLLCPHVPILPLCVPKSLSGSQGNPCITDIPDWSTDSTRARDVSFLLLAVSWLPPHKPQTQHKMLVTWCLVLVTSGLLSLASHPPVCQLWSWPHFLNSLLESNRGPGYLN